MVNTKKVLDNLLSKNQITLDGFNLLIETLKLDELLHDKQVFDLSSELRVTIEEEKLRILKIM